MTLLAGNQQDVEALTALFDQAAALKPHWNRVTLNHRITGTSNFEERLREGKITGRRTASVKAALERFIQEHAEGGGT